MGEAAGAGGGCKTDLSGSRASWHSFAVLPRPPLVTLTIPTIPKMTLFSRAQVVTAPFPGELAACLWPLRVHSRLEVGDLEGVVCGVV